jgi:putative ABC transport system ATP-binding protein
VMVTHEPRAAAIADRVLFLADGQIVMELPRSTQPEILAALEAITTTA